MWYTTIKELEIFKKLYFQIMLCFPKFCAKQKITFRIKKKIYTLKNKKFQNKIIISVILKQYYCIDMGHNSYISLKNVRDGFKYCEKNMENYILMKMKTYWFNNIS